MFQIWYISSCVYCYSLSLTLSREKVSVLNEIAGSIFIKKLIREKEHCCTIIIENEFKEFISSTAFYICDIIEYMNFFKRNIAPELYLHLLTLSNHFYFDTWTYVDSVTRHFIGFYKLWSNFGKFCKIMLLFVIKHSMPYWRYLPKQTLLSNQNDYWLCWFKYRQVWLKTWIYEHWHVQACRYFTF